MPAIEAPTPPKQGESTTVVLLIAIFKLVKGLLLIAVGVGAFKLLHRDVADTVMRWVDILRVDPENRFIHAGLERILRVSPGQLKALGAGTFFYAALLLTEGTGLLFRKHWAEYFTIVTTAALIPLEVFEIVNHTTPIKILVMVVNVAIVVYLVIRVMSRRSLTSRPAEASILKT